MTNQQRVAALLRKTDAPHILIDFAVVLHEQGTLSQILDEVETLQLVSTEDKTTRRNGFWSTEVPE